MAVGVAVGVAVLTGVAVGSGVGVRVGGGVGVAVFSAVEVAMDVAVLAGVAAGISFSTAVVGVSRLPDTAVDTGVATPLQPVSHGIKVKNMSRQIPLGPVNWVSSPHQGAGRAGPGCRHRRFVRPGVRPGRLAFPAPSRRVHF